MIYSLESVTKLFPQRHEPVQAINGVTLEVRPGELVALLGQSGAGKTTLFRLLNGTLRPTAGSLEFDASDTAAMSPRQLRAMRRRIGTIYQSHNLVPSLTAVENTLCGALGRMSLLGTVRSVFQPGKRDLAAAMNALELVGLADKRNARADELSGGQQQRLAAARVLMQSPDVILADEPTASLDPALADTITSLLARLAVDGRRTLIMAVHRVDLALQYFPRVVGLRGGCLSFDGPPSKVQREVLDALYARDSKSARKDDGDQFQLQLGCAR